MKEGLVNTFGVSHDKLPDDTNRRVTDLFFAATQVFLEAKVSVVVEAAFQHTLWKEAVVSWSDLAQLCFIIYDADPALCARRHLARGLDDPTREFYHGDKRVKTFRETGEFLGPGKYDPPSFDVPTLSVSTAEGYCPGLPGVREFIVETSA